MDVDILTEIVINRPIDQVSDYAANPDNAPEWYVNIKSIEWQTAPPMKVGSRAAFVAHFLGRRIAYTYEMRTFEPGKRLVMSTAEGPFPMETTYTWAPEDDGKSTRMTLRNTGVPSGFSALTAPLMKVAMRRVNKKDLESIKAILESR